ncbi:phosphatidylinositol 3,4,5-trisphosphate 3-phosphatase and dual-specificity protein phosphatase PTEN-like isoform X2 [Orbicella faveolata]|uniref:phosphatidylinositol 3,4,5-trisphosphate 3-phosphatase and dual-specificity protein phosphatase PTEN-like isoform X2 n=1 Tax=Orbicella faveolata TaxID=48498 RepID=UPI0009E5DC6C|nr:phosphatidylinositol 3,4,5-trisphosphate 3-phosphatase and dual-specificity protein phosphatase PTEN-like isoform X2 [Orbicella faveolata]
MSYFKALVSKKKRRFQEDGFDLDLTYIKPNIVAMGFPSDNLEGVYRNHIEEVLRFLETRHKDHYKIYNLCSERHYDPAKFNNRVATYPFDDHNAPPFELIEPFCDDVDKFLSEDEKNVAFIHCKAGKGRTGVMICAYLLHNHHFKESKDALKYYGDARTRNAKGVTIPSQRRYVLYYNHVLRHELVYTRTMVLLKRFEMLSESMFQNSTLNPYYIIWQQKVKLYQSKVDEGKKSNKGLAFEPSQPIPICGDIRVEFFNKDMFKKERMFQFWFNTFFISQQATVVQLFEDEPTLKVVKLDSDLYFFDIGKDDLDKAHKDAKEKIYNRDFKVRVTFSEVDSIAPSSSASLPRRPGAVKSLHKKSRSMDSFDREEIGSINHEEDNFSDTDNDEQWQEESMLPATQTTYV